MIEGLSKQLIVTAKQYDVLVDRLVEEIYKKCYKKHKIDCTTRSQLLYVALKNIGLNPIMLRYLNSKDQEKRVKIRLLSGEKYESHVVILLDNNILDSNLLHKMTKEEYDKKIREINKGITVISIKYQSPINKEWLEKMCEECNLSSFFTEALKNPENFK